MPRCLIIAGPNGAGKTTFALRYLPRFADISRFINADMIAAGLSPLAPERHAAAAARLFLEEMNACVDARQDFAFETTLSGRGYLSLIDRLREAGWSVELYYLALPTVELSKSRVAERVAHGGHNIPTADIERRFPRSLRNLLVEYSMRVDECRCYLNTGTLPQQIFERYGDELIVQDAGLFDRLSRLAGLD